MPTGLGDLSPDGAPETRNWRDHVVELRRDDPELVAFLERVAPPTPRGQSWTREPFRRWALEVSRYSFETGQEVLTRRHNSARAATPDPP